jgi:surface polysaccharide O-acyltransferase-like enzyme
MQSLSRSRYDADVDVMRLVAAFCVTLVHAAGLGSVAACVYNAAGRFSVPVFVLISGYYMLSRPSPPKSLIRRSCRLLVYLLVFSAVYCLYFILSGLKQYAGIGDLITFLLTQPIHFWYIYAIIALYAFTPALHVFAKNAGRGEYRYLLFLTFLFGSVVTMLLRAGVSPVLTQIIEKMKVPYLLGFIFLYLLGGYFRRHWPGRPARLLIYTLGIAGTLVSVAYAVATKSELWLSFFAPNVQLSGIAFFVFVKQLFASRPLKSEKAKAALRFFAKGTLIVYLLHLLFLLLLKDSFKFANALSIPLKALVAFACSMAAACIFNLCAALLRKKG